MLQWYGFEAKKPPLVAGLSPCHSRASWFSGVEGLQWVPPGRGKVTSKESWPTAARGSCCGQQGRCSAHHATPTTLRS